MYRAKFLMNVWAPTLGDATRNVLRSLMTTSFLGQLNAKAARGKSALSGTSVYALAIDVVCRIGYLGATLQTARKDQAVRPKLQIFRSRRSRKPKEH